MDSRILHIPGLPQDGPDKKQSFPRRTKSIHKKSIMYGGGGIRVRCRFTNIFKMHSAPRRMPTMESYLWNTGAIVIVNDMVEPATMEGTQTMEGTAPMARTTRLPLMALMAGMERMSADFLSCQSRLANFCASQSFFFMDISRTDISDVVHAMEGVKTEHLTGRSTHADFLAARRMAQLFRTCSCFIQHIALAP